MVKAKVTQSAVLTYHKHKAFFPKISNTGLEPNVTQYNITQANENKAYDNSRRNFPLSSLLKEEKEDFETNNEPHTFGTRFGVSRLTKHHVDWIPPWSAKRKT